MPEFFETGMGRKFYESTVPELANAVKRLAVATEERGWKELLTQMLASPKGRKVVLGRLLEAFQKAGEIEEFKMSPRHKDVWSIAESERRLSDAEYVIRIIKSRDTDEGVVFVGSREKKDG